MQDLSDLIARVRAATEGGNGIDRELLLLEVPEMPRAVADLMSDEFFPPYTASLDAALALVERCLPGTRMLLNIGPTTEATFWPAEEDFVRAIAPTAPLAVILALLLALEGKA